MNVSSIKCTIIDCNNGSFGLMITCDGEQPLIFSDLCSNFARLSDLSGKINSGHVSPCHINDIIEDFLE